MIAVVDTDPFTKVVVVGLIPEDTRDVDVTFSRVDASPPSVTSPAALTASPVTGKLLSMRGGPAPQCDAIASSINAK
jgi:hypothetical protein